ncbi:hypothetical protein HK096_003043 [Nowakowskiella sp. JEL0078]|nr:hypothetical protein HK096_003043 [Nowakowskiella sp. JEL0078]
MSTFPKPHLIPTAGTYPLGFLANSISSGIKKSNSKDLSLMSSPYHPCTVSGVFTQNSFPAAPVLVSREQLKTKPLFHSLLVNSGCANACTGAQGLTNARESVRLVNQAVTAKYAVTNASVLVCSTGVIGQQLPMDKVSHGIPDLVAGLADGHDSWMRVAQGIMTTDTFPKLRSGEFTTPEGAKYRMAGWCKGAGMVISLLIYIFKLMFIPQIHPNMATLLSAIFTDARISKECLDVAVRHAVERSFNAITIDGDTSTNDTFVVFSNGAAVTGFGAQPIIDDVNSPEFAKFIEDFTLFSSDLSKLIVRDGEGATKLIDVIVKGGRSFEECKHVATTVAKSPLVKTAIYGRDANWGRVVCAVGYSYVKDLNPEKVNLWIKEGTHGNEGSKKLHLFKNGAPFDVNEEVASEILEGEDIILEIDLGFGGDISAIMSTCDFSEDYIKINADYRS